MTGSSKQAGKTPLDVVSEPARPRQFTRPLLAVMKPAQDVGGGRMVATVTDPGDNVLGLPQHQ
jgi:hypothetical protein